MNRKYVYIVYFPQSTRVKIGAWTSTIRVLRARYVTPFGNDLTLLTFETNCPFTLEKLFWEKFIDRCICNELYKIDFLDQYISFFDKFKAYDEKTLQSLFIKRDKPPFHTFVNNCSLFKDVHIGKKMEFSFCPLHFIQESIRLDIDAIENIIQDIQDVQKVQEHDKYKTIRLLKQFDCLPVSVAILQSLNLHTDQQFIEKITSTNGLAILWSDFQEAIKHTIIHYPKLFETPFDDYRLDETPKSRIFRSCLARNNLKKAFGLHLHVRDKQRKANTKRLPGDTIIMRYIEKNV